MTESEREIEASESSAQRVPFHGGAGVRLAPTWSSGSPGSRRW